MVAEGSGRGASRSAQDIAEFEGTIGVRIDRARGASYARAQLYTSINPEFDHNGSRIKGYCHAPATTLAGQSQVYFTQCCHSQL